MLELKLKLCISATSRPLQILFVAYAETLAKIAFIHKNPGLIMRTAVFTVFTLPYFSSDVNDHLLKFHGERTERQFSGPHY